MQSHYTQATPHYSTEQGRKKAMSISRQVYHAKQSPVRKQVCTWAGRVGGREYSGLEKAGPRKKLLSYPGKTATRSATYIETTEKAKT